MDVLFVNFRQGSGFHNAIVFLHCDFTEKARILFIWAAHYDSSSVIRIRNSGMKRCRLWMLSVINGPYCNACSLVQSWRFVNFELFIIIFQTCQISAILNRFQALSDFLLLRFQVCLKCNKFCLDGSTCYLVKVFLRYAFQWVS